MIQKEKGDAILLARPGALWRWFNGIVHNHALSESKDNAFQTSELYEQFILLPLEVHRLKQPNLFAKAL